MHKICYALKHVRPYHNSPVKNLHHNLTIATIFAFPLRLPAVTNSKKVPFSISLFMEIFLFFFVQRNQWKSCVLEASIFSFPSFIAFFPFAFPTYIHALTCGNGCECVSFQERKSYASDLSELEQNVEKKKIFCV